MILNIDVGELHDEPAELYELADVVNIACTGHAGDDATMSLALRRAIQYKCGVSAHPSYPDRAGFGRKKLEMDFETLKASIAEQCSLLLASARQVGVSIMAIKPHGALYHQCAVDRDVARATWQAGCDILKDGAVWVGPKAGFLREEVEIHKGNWWVEVFADRGMNPDGTLIPRGQKGDLLVDVDSVTAQVKRLLVDRERNHWDTICIHGDTQGAVALAKAVRAAIGPKREKPLEVMHKTLGDT